MDEVQHPVRRPSVEMILNGSYELFGTLSKIINFGMRCNRQNHHRLSLIVWVGFTSLAQYTTFWGLSLEY